MIRAERAHPARCASARAAFMATSSPFRPNGEASSTVRSEHPFIRRPLINSSALCQLAEDAAREAPIPRFLCQTIARCRSIQ